MSTQNKTTTSTPNEDRLPEQLAYLKLTAVLQHYAPMAEEAAQQHWSHVEYLARLVEARLS